MGANMKTRKKFTREFKISILRELENGKSAAQVCRENGINISMSRKGNPYENAFAESFIKTLKYEEVYL